MRLAAASGDGSIRVWDARPLTAGVKAEGAALDLLDALSAQPLSRAEAIACIERDQRLSAAVRAKALTLVEPYWKGIVHRQAFPLVEGLFAKPLLKADVLAQLRANRGLREEVRQEALAVAERWQEDPRPLHAASWAVVRQASAAADQYRQALQWADAACQLEPANGRFATTRGGVQYRVGQYPEALQTLLRAEQLQPGLPATLAFLALTQYRLGQSQQAQATFTRLQKTTQESQWAQDAEAQALLCEAQALFKR